MQGMMKLEGKNFFFETIGERKRYPLLSLMSYYENASPVLDFRLENEEELITRPEAGERYSFPLAEAVRHLCEQAGSTDRPTAKQLLSLRLTAHLIERPRAGGVLLVGNADISWGRGIMSFLSRVQPGEKLYWDGAEQVEGLPDGVRRIGLCYEDLLLPEQRFTAAIVDTEHAALPEEAWPVLALSLREDGRLFLLGSGGDAMRKALGLPAEAAMDYELFVEKSIVTELLMTPQQWKRIFENSAQGIEHFIRQNLRQRLQKLRPSSLGSRPDAVQLSAACREARQLEQDAAACYPYLPVRDVKMHLNELTDSLIRWRLGDADGQAAAMAWRAAAADFGLEEERS